MDWISIILIVLNIILGIMCFASWHEVRVLRGDYGGGVCSELNYCLVQAKEARSTTTILFVTNTCLTISAILFN